MSGQKFYVKWGVWFWTLTLVFTALASGLIVGCGKPQSSKQVPRLTQAYRLMDKGENAKAIDLLLEYLNTSPNSEEAKVLLASAYMGQAGVDVYALHDSFSDLIFAKPLSESFWGGKEAGSGPFPAEDATVPPQGRPQPDPSPGTSPDPSSSPQPLASPSPAPPPILKSIVFNLGDFLNKVRRMSQFMGRFPEVTEERWKLLDHALLVLDSIEGPNTGRDLLLYRVFVRVVYIKAYADVKILGDPNVGTQGWGCHFEVAQASEDADWLSAQLDRASRDYDRAFPNQASRLARAHGYLEELAIRLKEARNADDGSPIRRKVVAAQKILRAVLGCENNPALPGGI